MLNLESIHDFGRLQFVQAWAGYTAVEHQAFIGFIMKYATSIKHTSMKIKPNRAEHSPIRFDAAIAAGLRMFRGQFVGSHTDVCIEYCTVVGIKTFHQDGDWTTRFNMVHWCFVVPKEGTSLDDKYPDGVEVSEFSFDVKGPAILASKEQENMPFNLKAGDMLLDNDSFVTQMFGLSQVGGYKPD